MSEFRLDDRLERDAPFVIDLSLCQARLMNDARYPWFILVPRRDGLRDFDDLSVEESAAAVADVRRASAAVRRLVSADRPITKLNVASLGNVVEQLHIHVIGRRTDDPAWPGPVWNVGEAEPYGDVLDAVVEAARAALS